jgi:hypothetical protein
MKFSNEQIDFLKETFLSMKLDEEKSSSIIQAITKKETKKDDSKLCTATTKSGTRCTKKSKEDGLCAIHLKSQTTGGSVKPKKIKKSEEFVEEMSDEDKKKEIEQLFEGV